MINSADDSEASSDYYDAEKQQLSGLLGDIEYDQFELAQEDIEGEEVEETTAAMRAATLSARRRKGKQSSTSPTEMTVQDIQDASIAAATDEAYRGAWKRFLKFVETLKRGKVLPKAWTPDSLNEAELPYILASWIAVNCMKTKIKIQVGNMSISMQGKGLKYGTADQIRSAATDHYMREHNRSGRWVFDKVNKKSRGSPTRAICFLKALTGIMRIKAKEGERNISKKGMTSALLKTLYGHIFKTQTAPKAEFVGIYMGLVVGFLCLLRTDEIVNIQFRNIHLSRNKDYIVLDLDFRKTHQTGSKTLFTID
jgi:hypothetical protein